jgi:hypothetical protein
MVFKNLKKEIKNRAKITLKNKIIKDKKFKKIKKIIQRIF